MGFTGVEEDGKQRQPCPCKDPCKKKGVWISGVQANGVVELDSSR